MKPLAEKETNRQKCMQEKISQIYKENNFSSKREYLSAGNDSLIACGEDGRFCFMHIENALETNINRHSYDYTFIKPTDILEVKLFKDNENIINVSKTGLIGGALLGGAIAGNIGSILGGMTSNKKSVEKIKSLSLKVTVNNKEKPIYTIEIFNHKKGLQGEKYTKNAIDEIEYWFNLMKVVMHENKQQNMISY